MHPVVGHNSIVDNARVSVVDRDVVRFQTFVPDMCMQGSKMPFDLIVGACLGPKRGLRA